MCDLLSFFIFRTRATSFQTNFVDFFFAFPLNLTKSLMDIRKESKFFDHLKIIERAYKGRKVKRTLFVTCQMGISREYITFFIKKKE